ncbi:MAG: terminase [Gammaproteobacteria bacterium]|nr:terminase [Gammaproteobacteria bacterium]
MLQQLLNLTENSPAAQEKKHIELEEDLLLRLGAECSLKLFTEQAWHVLEPATPFIDGWHLDAISEHLEAAAKKQIKRLIINIPPRHMKSLLCSVFFPCWVWLTDPSSRWLFSSYAQDLSTRDSLKCRRLIQSKWYQEGWGHKYQITSDQNQKTRFENDRTGVRLSTSVDSLACGEGGDYIVVDDPHNTKQVESVLKRNNVLVWWDEVISSRLNDINTGVKIIVMQRLHESDLTGHILEKELGYVHLMLPAEFERERRCRTIIGFVDPRKEEYEPLWKGKNDEEALAELKKDLSSQYAIAGQLQQRPSPRGGGMFKIENFKIINTLNVNHILKSVRYWDKAATLDGGCYTAGVLMHKMKDGSFVVSDRVMGQWSVGIREKIIKQTTILDGERTHVWVEREPGGAGIESADNTIRNLAGYIAESDRVTGSKPHRAIPYANQVEIGNVSLIKNEWTKDFIDHHGGFPFGKIIDDVDAAAGAFAKLTQKRGKIGTW